MPQADYDPTADSKACWELAIACGRAQTMQAYVRDPGSQYPLEMIVWHRERGQWAILDIDPSHALQLAKDLIEGAGKRLK